MASDLLAQLTDNDLVALLRDSEKIVERSEIDADLWPVAYARVLDIKLDIKLAEVEPAA